MKIVQVEDFFHPDAGYQINIISKYFAQAGNAVTIITSKLDHIDSGIVKFFGKDKIEEKDKRYTEKYNVKIIRLPVKRIISGRAAFTNEIFNTIIEEKPDIVFVHGNDTLIGMQYLLKYRKLGFPLIMDSHMLEMASKNKLSKLFHLFYKAIFTPIIVKNNINVIRTQNDIYVNKCLGIPLKLAPWISVGSDTMIFHPDPKQRKIFRKNNNINDDDFIVLYAGKLDESKGGMILAEAIQKKIISSKKVVFCIVGNTVGDYGKKVEKVFSESENRVLRFPTQKYEDLAVFYQAADMAVFPRQCSLSFYDVQACGLPVLFEDNTVNTGRISRDNAKTFESNNTNDFRNKIIEMANLEPQKFDEMKRRALEYIKNGYDYEALSKKYLNIIESEMRRQGEILN